MVRRGGRRMRMRGRDVRGEGGVGINKKEGEGAVVF